MKNSLLAVFVALASSTASAFAQDASPTPPPLSAEDQAFADSGGEWIEENTWGAGSKEDFDELLNMMLSNDAEAMLKMVRAGRAVMLKQGQRVQLQDASMFSGTAKIRLFGETKSWWIESSKMSSRPVMTQEEKLRTVQTTSTSSVSQKPLIGALSAVKLFLGQPLTEWEKAYPSHKPSFNNPFAYIFKSGRFLIAVIFDEKSGLAHEVQISELEGKAPLTTKEATQIAASIGLTKPPSKDAEEPSTLNWNKQADPLFAQFGTDKDDRTLTITYSRPPEPASKNQ